MVRLIDADELEKSIIKKLGIASEEFLLESEKAVFEEIDKAPTIDAPKSHTREGNDNTKLETILSIRANSC